MSKKILEDVVAKKTLQFRDGVFAFFDLLYVMQIPLVIISASIGDMIVLYLEQANKYYDNIHLVSNFLEFDQEGKMIGVKPPIIHCMNKSELVLPEFSFYDEVKSRKNVLLLGDSLEDLAMVDVASCANLLTI